MSRSLKRILTYGEIILLGFIQAAVYILFVVDNKFAPAGVNGIATMIQYKFGFSIGYLTLIVNVPLSIFAMIKIDKDFGINSLLFCTSNALFYLLLQHLDQTFDLSIIKYDSGGVDTIFPCIIAGVIVGFVYSRCFKLNASTGGTDIPAMYISKKKPFFNFFFVNIGINVVIAFASLFVYSTDNVTGAFDLDYKPVVLCILYTILTGIVANQIIKNEKKAYLFTVISPHTSAIEKEIIEKLNHTATKITAEGVYSKKEEHVLLCVIGRSQIADFEQILKKYPDTFAYASDVVETLGKFNKKRIG